MLDNQGSLFDTATADLPIAGEGIVLLSDARKWLQQNLDDGVRCLCCDKYARRYYRKFNSTMARSLLWLVQAWESNAQGWIDVPKMAPRQIVRSNQLPTVRWWGMVERPDNSDGKDVKHSGFWKPTPKGVDFVYKRIMVPSTAVTYDGCVEKMEGEPISIEDALGTHFSYSDIMGE